MNKRRSSLILIIFLLILVLLFGVIVIVLLSPTPTPTQTALATRTLTVTTTDTPTTTSTGTTTSTATITFTPSPTLFPEPKGCLQPPEDYSRLQVDGHWLNQRTYAMLQHAAGIYNGVIDVSGNALTQGNYTDSEPLSFGTHAGGGAVDISVLDRTHWEILYDEIDPLIRALRIAGFAAWLREYGELNPGSPIHIHAIAIGDAELSYAAREQLTGQYGYFRGYTGVPTEDGIPLPDRHGGPILCRWMIDLGYQDLRQITPEAAP
ncbi:MAG: hypothetical protein FVQ83_14445 [Chloroflexi bacterium]|nr:hypothetical protein [Chloroflexota bacterium]